MKHKPTKAQQEKAQSRREAFAQLTKRLPADPDELSAMAFDLFIKNVEGHELSSANQILLTWQRENVTVVGGYDQWRKQGRHVKKEESGLCIWVPGKSKEKEGTPTKEGESKVWFFLGTVFDISQTEVTEEKDPEGAIA